MTEIKLSGNENIDYFMEKGYSIFRATDIVSAANATYDIVKKCGYTESFLEWCKLMNIFYNAAKGECQ